MGHHASNVASNVEVHSLRFAVDAEVKRLTRKGCSPAFAFRLACLHVFGRAK
jgi:hypothetical protein